MNDSLRNTTLVLSVLLALSAALPSLAQVAVRGETIYTMAGDPIRDGVVVVTDGKIAAVGPADRVRIPDGHAVLEAKVVTPGLIDARATVGLTGIYNHPHDQDVVERSSPIQPELRAIDAYNPRDQLIEWVRSFGVTTVHTGHAPGELITGQTMIVKLRGNTVEDALVRDVAAVSATLSPRAHRSGGQSPGTRGKAVAMLRQELIRAQEYMRKLDRAADNDEEENKRPSRDLKLEMLVQVLRGEVPLMVMANRAQDIASVLRIKEEFGIPVWLESAAESYLLTDRIRDAGVPVIVHPSMYRASGELENMSFETAAKLREAGVPVAIESGYESYVPKVRVVLFEAAIAAANGLGLEGALATITIDAARILGIDDRVGSIEIGKDGDLALYDGDPFEYLTQCTGVIIEGQIVSDTPR